MKQLNPTLDSVLGLTSAVDELSDRGSKILSGFAVVQIFLAFLNLLSKNCLSALLRTFF